MIKNYMNEFTTEKVKETTTKDIKATLAFIFSYIF